MHSDFEVGGWPPDRRKYPWGAWFEDAEAGVPPRPGLEKVLRVTFWRVEIARGFQLFGGGLVGIGEREKLTLGRVVATGGSLT